MSFWKKLLGKKAQEAGAEDAGQDPRKMARPPRVRLGALHGVTFAADGEFERLGSLKVYNLSAQGIGFERGSERAWPRPGAILTGKLRMAGQVFELRAEIRHLSDTIVGCKLQSPPAGYREAMLQTFFAELSALRMIRVNPDVLQKVDDGTPAFFVGENGCELYYVHQGEKLVRFNISFFGNYIEHDNGKTLAGTVDEGEGMESDGDVRHKGSALVRAAGSVTDDLRQTAERLLDNIEELDPVMRTRIRDLLQ